MIIGTTAASLLYPIRVTNAHTSTISLVRNILSKKKTKQKKKKKRFSHLSLVACSLAG